MKRLAILNGNEEALSAIKTAKDMGLYVIVVDGNPDCPGGKIADQFINANCYDPLDVVSALRYVDTDGVITVGAENLEAVCVASNDENLFVPVTRLISKSRQKKMLDDNHIPTPDWRQIYTFCELLDTPDGDYVLKPDVGRGARGVCRIKSRGDIFQAYNEAKKHNNLLLLEDYLDGPQFSVEGIVWKGRAHLAGVGDRNYDKLEETYPFIIENGGDTPSRFSPEFDYRLEDLLDRCAKAVGLERGTIKLDVVLNNNTLYVIELTCRLSGGYFSTDTIPKVYNYDLVKNAILIALGEEPELPPKPLVPVLYHAHRYEFPKDIKNHTQRGERKEFLAESRAKLGELLDNKFAR